MNLNVTASQIKMTSTSREQLRLKSNETVLLSHRQSFTGEDGKARVAKGQGARGRGSDYKKGTTRQAGSLSCKTHLGKRRIQWQFSWKNRSNF